MGGQGRDWDGTIIAVASLAVGLGVGTFFGINLDPSFSGNIADSSKPVEKIENDDPELCTYISKRLTNCLESNNHDINKCPWYFDLLKDCRKH